ncbi:MAG: YaeQ family protein [Alphaproteobacteria bacterium]|nr:YaeQ family protein [Alphaproteobacteria bacterium]
MALKSTIYKANLSVADIDHGYYADHALTLARHPNETDERMMVRILALALNAHELTDICQGDGTLAFGAGLSDPDDPDLSLKDFTGAIRLWAEVGQPEEKPLLKACQKADVVRLYAFHHAAEVWWRTMQSKVQRLDKLQIWRVPSESAQAMSRMAERSMQLQATVQDGAVSFSGAKDGLHIELERWK